MYYIGLDVHKKTISYCIKDASGQVYREGTIGAARNEIWMFGYETLPQPRMISDGGDDLHWMDLRSSAAARSAGEGSASADAACDPPLPRRRTNASDAGKIADCLR